VNGAPAAAHGIPAATNALSFVAAAPRTTVNDYCRFLAAITLLGKSWPVPSRRLLEQDLIVSDRQACGNWGECPVEIYARCGERDVRLISEPDRYVLQLEVLQDQRHGWRTLRELERGGSAGADELWQVEWSFRDGVGYLPDPSTRARSR
jgi:hypothetical protein